MIPARLIRTIPAVVDPWVENLWETACALHPTWEHVTLREPLDPAVFPYTSDLWGRCGNGAQKAGFVRLEALLTGGGVYIDSDMELWRPLDNLLGLRGFAGWEDPGVVPDAVLAAEPGHPAITDCLTLAAARIGSTVRDWRTGNGAWSTGPGVTTAVLPGRADFTVLPPGCFYPYHYSEKHRRREDHKHLQPWSYGAHHWAASWLPRPEG